MVSVSFDWKCGLTNAILTVLLYLLMLRMFSAQAGRPLTESAHWYESMEVLLLVSAFVGFQVNSMLFSGCTTSLAQTTTFTNPL